MKNKKSYLTVILITIILFLIILFMKEIFPFGKDFIGVLNFDEIYIPICDRLHDILYGKESLFYDFKLGGGNLIFPLLITHGMLNPLMILTCLFPKNVIPYLLSFVILIKFIIASLTSLYMIKKVYKKIDNKFAILGSILYTFSGYTLLLYSNLNFLDIVILIPLIIVGIDNIIKKKDSKLFIISLVLSIIFNIYVSIYIIIYLIINTFLYSIIFKSKTIFIKVLGNVIFSLLLTSFIWIFMLENGINISVYPLRTIMEKIIYIFPSGFLIILFIKQVMSKDKYSLFYLISILFTLILIPLKEIVIGDIYITFNAGIILITILLIGSMHYLNCNKKVFNKRLSDNIFYVGYFLLTFIMIYVTYTFRNVILDSNFSVSIEQNKQIVALLIMFFVSVLYVIISLYNDNKHFILISSLIIITSFSSLYITTSQLSTVKNSFNINFDINNEYRYKDNTASLGSNYSLIYGIPSISYYNNSKAQKYNQLGYTIMENQVYNGGTVFTDLLLGNKYIVSYTTLPSSLYNLIKEENSIYYYESKYNLNMVIPYNKINDIKFTSVLEYQNAIYKDLFNKKDDIVKIEKPIVELKNISVSENNMLYATNENNKMSFKLNVKQLSEVYLNLQSTYGQVYSIKVNGKLIKNPIYINRHNTKYPASLQNILYLGEYENSELLVEMSTEFIQIDDFNVGIIPVSKVIDLVNEYNNSLQFEYEKGKILITGSSNYNNILIPINYNKNLKITNNNKEVNYEKAYNNFISIPILEDNNIVIEYKDNSILIGFIISIISLITFIGKKKILCYNLK